MEVIQPDTVGQVSAVMRQAAREGRTVRVRGGGTKSGWGPPAPEADLLLDLRGLGRIVEHAAGDMVVRAEAGVPMATLTAELAGAGQQLAVDLPAYDDGTVPAGSTLGGALAVGLAGPRRLRYGRLRDLLLGVTMVRADGVVASSGGRVVKNVAGYDLGKLLTGSYGTLGVIVSATLRLHPVPPARAWVTARLPTPVAAHRCATALLGSQVAVSAVEVDRPAGGEAVSVAALLEGTADGVAARAAATADLVGGAVASEPPEWFGRWPGGPDGTLIEVRVPPAGLADALALVEAAADAAGLAAPARGSAGAATLHVGLPADADPAAVGPLASPLGSGLVPCRGYAVVRHAPPPVAATVDFWGPVDPGALALMRRVKDQFDPDHRLSPGRFVGGI